MVTASHRPPSSSNKVSDNRHCQPMDERQTVTADEGAVPQMECFGHRSCDVLAAAAAAVALVGHAAVDH